MKSGLPKVLHKLAGTPLLCHVIDTARLLDPEGIHIVIGHGADKVRKSVAQPDIVWAIQEEQLGTGHAVMQALPNIPDDSRVLILYGDVPLTTSDTLQRLIANPATETMALLTVQMAFPKGYGRIVRDQQGNVLSIVEEKDASPAQRQINEVNSGIMAANASDLKRWLPKLSSENAQGEYYLTDIIEMATNDGIRIDVAQPDENEEVQGVNDRVQLAQLETWFQLRAARELMLGGATLLRPDSVSVRGHVVTGQDVVVDANVIFEGHVDLGDGVEIGPNCILRDVTIKANSVVKANSMIEDSVIGERAELGPFARVRPGTVLEENSKIGNFVETKKSIIGAGSKVNHLSYIGDTTIGRDSNIGAGTITCNYDGVNKFRSDIGNDVFVGSNSSLVAPVTIKDGATIGAGSVVTHDVDEGQLAVGRSKQRNIDGWQRPIKK